MAFFACFMKSKIKKMLLNFFGCNETFQNLVCVYVYTLSAPSLTGIAG